MCTFPSCFLSAGLSWGASRSVLFLPGCPRSVAGCGPRRTQGSCTRALRVGTGWGRRLCGSPFAGSHEPSLGRLFQPVGAFEEDDGLAFLHQPFKQAQGWRFPCRASLWAGLPSSLLRKRSCVLAPGLSRAMVSPQLCGEAGGRRARAGPNTYGCLPWSTGAQWLSRAHDPAVGYEQTQRGVSPPLHSDRGFCLPGALKRSSLSSCSAHASF